ncbi:mitochondrial ATP synthase epsilon chain-domain-containing protein, partial [Hysterangium stoloniferum]
SFNKYSQIAARALRQSLKEGERLQAERRGITLVRYQNWENGKGGEQVRCVHNAVGNVYLTIHCFRFG